MVVAGVVVRIEGRMGVWACMAVAVAGIADIEEQEAGMSIGDIGWAEDWNTAGGQEVLGIQVLAAAAVVAKEAAVNTWMEVVQAFLLEL